MEEIDQELKEYARRALGPKLSDDRISDIVKILQEKGVEYISDLHDKILNRVQLFPLLPEVQVNKLYHTWQEEKEQQARPIIQNCATPVQDVFRVDFEAIGMKEHLESETKLTDSLYNTFVQLVVAQKIKYMGPQNPGIKFIRVVARQIATKYPHHFFEKCGDQVLTTCNGLELKLKSHRSYRTSGTNNKKRKSTETYGCVDPAPEPPEEYTEEQLEERREELVAMHELPSKDWDQMLIKAAMEVTYSSQRKFINKKKPSTTDLLISWPFLKYFNYFMMHFQRLTGIYAMEKINNFLEEQASTYINFFTTFSKINKSSTIIKMNLEFAWGVGEVIAPTRLFAVLQMISEYMKDDFDDFLLIRAETCTDKELESDALIPATPIIVALGSNIWTSTKFCVVVENKVLDRVDTADQAVALHFASFYVQNLQYPTEVNSTLDYLQRYVLELDPEVKGTKCSKKGNGSCPELRLNVKKLNSEVDDFLNIRRKIREKYDVI